VLPLETTNRKHLFRKHLFRANAKKDKRRPKIGRKSDEKIVNRMNK